MEIRAYAHPYEPVDLLTVQGWDDATLARMPIQLVYHAAADLDDQARTVERDCEALWAAMEVREELIVLLEALGVYPDRLAALRDTQRIDRSNWGLGCRMLRECGEQQARLQWTLSHRDPHHWVEDETDPYAAEPLHP